MASAARSLISLFTILCLISSTILIGAGIYTANNDADPSTAVPLKFVIPAAVLNTLLVLALLYLTATITSIGSGMKLLISFILIAGLVLEIYLSNYVTAMPQSIGTYFVVVLNFLIRTFYVLQFTQDEWTRPFGVTVPTIQEVAKAVAPAPAPRPQPQPQPPAQPKERPIDKWDVIWKRIRDSSKGIDESAQKQAYREIIKPAREKGNLTLDVVQQAARSLKYKDGTPIDPSDIKLGGRS